MRASIVVGLAGVALASLAACGKSAPAASGGAATTAPAAPSAPAAGPLTAQDVPHPRVGLWRQTMTVEGGNTPMPVTKTCLDAASEAKMSIFGKNIRNGHCEGEQISRNADGSISSSSVCSFGPGGKTVSNSTMSGDFNSSYKIVIHSKPETGPERVMTITSTWLGPCAPGQRGGDVIMPDGKTINVTDAN